MSYLPQISPYQNQPGPIASGPNQQTWQMGGGSGPGTQPQFQQPQQQSPYQPPMAQPTLYGGSPDPSQALNQYNLYNQYQTGIATNNLKDILSAAGIVGGAATPAMTQLQAQLAGAAGQNTGNLLQNVMGLNQQAGLANTGWANQFTGMNIQDLLNMAQFQGGMQNQDWLAQLGAMSGINQAGLGGQLGLAQQQASNFPVTGSLAPGFGALGNQLGGYFQNKYANQNPWAYMGGTQSSGSGGT